MLGVQEAPGGGVVEMCRSQKVVESTDQDASQSIMLSLTNVAAHCWGPAAGLVRYSSDYK